jgi:hypothetical protein
LGSTRRRVRALLPARRLVDVARYGMAAKAPALRRHPAPRRLATLVATVVHLSASSIDDCLELFDVLMVTELLGKAQRETEKQHAAEHPRLARASAKLAAAVRALLEASASGEALQVADVWRSIETVVPRAELGAALATVQELVPNVDSDDEGEMRASLAERIRLVSGFIRPLCEVIQFGANAEGAAVSRRCGGCRSCSRPAATWQMAGRCIGIARLVCDALELGYTAECCTLRARCTSADRLADIFPLPEGTDLVRKWLADAMLPRAAYPPRG